MRKNEAWLDQTMPQGDAFFALCHEAGGHPSLDTDLTRNTHAPHFTPQHWLLCHMGLYWFEFEFAGGHMGDSAYDFLGVIIDSAGGSASDRM